ncbi:RIP metalloprotease RseP [Candidatus Peregrinibacteria bacterium]|nr:RIP metalloprotease RseP [Candidatus Peregrinibacteria bacterium]
MSILITIVAFIVIFSLLILIHEFGHFYMAKRAGIKVEEFGFGLPPRIWGKKKGETIYSINWIPFGGFVRMFGEDATDPKLLRSSRSFVAKPMRDRVKVVVAGVMMNFLLAWFLMFVGFTAGMQPLLGPDDVLTSIGEGQVTVDSGLRVRNVEKGSLSEQLGIEPEDVFYSFNGKPIDSFVFAEIADNPVGNYVILRGDQSLNVSVSKSQLKDLSKDGKLGVLFYDGASLPRVKIYDLDKNSFAYKAGLRSADVIISVNGQQVFDVEQFEQLVRGVPVLEYKIYRNGLLEDFLVEREEARQVVVSKVLPDSPAAEAGIIDGDVILSVNGKDMTDSLELITFVSENADQNLAYQIERGDKRLFYEIVPEEGKIGVYLSELINYSIDPGMSLYNVDLYSSVLEIKDEKYPFYTAWYEAFGETWHLSKLTGEMFVSFVAQLISDGSVPESVAGPVGIAQMTHVFVQEGFIPLLRFVAILSLSLAVINILPFPALDGGRLFFILIEWVIGRRVPQKWEAWIHGLGYILIILLIFAVTYSDIMRLIAS